MRNNKWLEENNIIYISGEEFIFIYFLVLGVNIKILYEAPLLYHTDH